MNQENLINGTLILVLGIVGLAFSLAGLGSVGLPCGLAAWGMGYKGIKKLNAYRVFDSPDRKNASIGLTCGILTLAVFLVRLLIAALASRQ